MLRERVEHRWQDPDALLPARPKTREDTHLRATSDIAAQRFVFPTPKYPAFRTYVNVPEPKLVIRTEEGRDLAPDIVVAEWPGNAPKILGDIETVDTVTEESAREKWRPHSQFPGANSYLYVPTGYGHRARMLLKRMKVKNVGLRTWRYVAGLDTLDITEITYGGLLDLLMPPPLVRRR